MNCPPEVAGTVAEMLKYGLLSIRAAGWSDDASSCAVQADHLHNLPGLLTNYSPDLLLYYWNVERPGYISRTLDVSGWERFWERLLPHIRAIESSPR